MLYEIDSELGFVGTSTTGETLTRLIAASNSRLDISSWIARLGRIETQVCRVEIEEFGVHHDTTGFLVGPDLLMTTYHSFQMVIAGNASPRSVRFRFDYKASPDGTTINTGTVYSLAESDWLIDYSPSGVPDLLCRWDEPPLPNLLDYVLVRLAGSPGKEPVGAERAEYDAMPRGWIEIPSHPAKFQTGTALFVVHHSSGSPLKVSLDTDAVIGLNENGTRVWYKVNEMAGSSGAPCFDSNWKLVAMHHASVHGMVGKEDERRVIHTTTYTCLIEFTKSEEDPTKGTHV